MYTLEELIGWQEEISDENAIDYIGSAMQIIKDLQAELKESRERESNLLNEYNDMEDLYTKSDE